MKFWNLTASQNAAGEKVLTISIFGTIEPGFFDDGGVRSAEVAAQLNEHADAAEVNALINSLGGDPFAGVAIYNLLRNHPAAKAGRLTSTVTGIAASAASVIAMAGKTVMQRGSMLMIHNPWTLAIGDASDLRATADTLDAIRDSLLSVYRAKTGKKPAELRALLDAETWLGADDAKRHGFADAVDDAPVKARADGESVFLNTVAFPRAQMPAPILAMVSPPATDITIRVPPGADPKAIEDAIKAYVAAPEPPKPAPITRDLLAAEAPALLAALLDEGATNERKGNEAAITAARAEGLAAGIASERARLKEIDELAGGGHADLVAAAKYGEKPIEARDLAVLIVKADRQAGSDRLEQRRAESAEAARIRPTPPDQTDQARREANVKSMVDVINAGRGGTR